MCRKLQDIVANNRSCCHKYLMFKMRITCLNIGIKVFTGCGKVSSGVVLWGGCWRFYLWGRIRTSLSETQACPNHKKLCLNPEWRHSSAISISWTLIGELLSLLTLLLQNQLGAGITKAGWINTPLRDTQQSPGFLLHQPHSSVISTSQLRIKTSLKRQFHHHFNVLWKDVILDVSYQSQLPINCLVIKK